MVQTLGVRTMLDIHLSKLRRQLRSVTLTKYYIIKMSCGIIERNYGIALIYSDIYGVFAL